MFQVTQQQNASKDDPKLVNQQELKLPKLDKKQTIKDLSEEEAKELVKSYQSKIGSASAIERKIESYLKYKNPEATSLELDTLRYSLSGKDALDTLIEASKDPKFSEVEDSAVLVKQLDLALNTTGKEKVLQILKDATGKASLIEAVLILSLNEEDSERMLHALSSQGFKEFSKNVQKELDIDISKNVISLEQRYKYHLENESILNPSFIKAVHEFRKVFPEIGISSSNDLLSISNKINLNNIENGHNFELEEFKVELSQLRKTYDNIKNNYSVKIDNVSSIFDLNGLFKEAANVLAIPRSKEVLSYIKENYPKLDLGESLSYNFLNANEGFVKGYASVILKDLYNSPETIDSYLKLFGKNLSNTDIRSARHLITNRISTPLEDLISDPKFSAFIEEQFKRFPDLKNSLNLEKISGLSFAYENQDKYEALQKAINKFEKLSLPILNLSDSERIINVLETVNKLGFAKLKIQDISEQNWGSTLRNEENISLLESQEAKELYKVLTEKWGIKNIELDDFINTLPQPEVLNFVINKENIEKIKKLDELYNIGINKTDESTKISSFYSKKNVLIENFDLLSKPEVAEFFKLYNPANLKSPDDPKVSENLSSLKYFSGYDTLKNFEEISKSAKILVKEFGIENKNVFSHLKFISSKILQSEELKSSYTWAKNVYCSEIKSVGDKKYNPIDSEFIFNIALTVFNVRDIDSTISAVENIGLTRGQYSLAYLEKFLHEDESVREIIRDTKFQELAKKLDSHFFNNKHDISRLLEYAELYRELKQDQNRLDAILSKDFKDITSTIGQMFHVATERPSTILPMIKVADGFKKSELEGLVGLLKLKGEKISSNDVMLLVEITKRPELRNLLDNREELLKELSSVYGKQSFPRQSIDQLSVLPEASPNNDQKFIDQRNKERAAVISNYSERPNLEEFSNLQLLRLTLINRALHTEEFKEKLGKIAVSDISDKSTEKGGNIQIDKGKLSLVETASTSSSDGQFQNQKYNWLIDGISTFHLHALEKDESKYSGPSGWLGNSGADIGFVEFYESVDTVFTAMGHPLDAEGKPITDQLRMNADTYFVDKRDPKKPILRIIDLGEVIVPYKGN